MSSNENQGSNGNGNDVAVGREVAYRLFAAEYDDSTLSHTESDEERAPNYVITPTGARINRLFVVGTLTEVSPVNDEMVRARVVDPTGAFVVYAGQYQPEALAFLERSEPPLFVAVTGKARTFQPDDSDQVYTSIRPENIATVDADTRDRWVVTSAEQTFERIGAYATATQVDARGDGLTDALLDGGLEEGLARGIPLAQDHYGTTPAYLEGLRTLALEAVEVVAEERDQVGSFGLDPGDAGSGGSFDGLADSSDLTLEVGETREIGEAEETGDITEGVTADQTAADAEASSATSEASAASEVSETSDVADGDALEAAAESESTPTAADEAAAETAFDDSTDVTADETAGTTADETASSASDEPADRDGVDAVGANGDGDDLEVEDVDAADVGGQMYEMDDEERAELEAEFGAEFTTGTEVDEPGSADIETPDESADAEAEGDDSDEETTGEETTGETLGDFQPQSDGLEDATESETDEETAGDVATEDEDDVGDESEDRDEEEVDDIDETEEGDGEGDIEAAEDESEPAEDVDLQEYVVDTMRDLDDGDGADRSAVVERVVADTGAAEDDVEDAIGDALMGGQCYEPDDETLKAI